MGLIRGEEVLFLLLHVRGGGDNHPVLPREAHNPKSNFEVRGKVAGY